MKFAASLSLLASTAPLVASVVRASPLVTRATQSAPHWVAYWDKWLSGENGPPDPSAIKGFNTLILSFLLSSGPADQVQEWASLTAASRSSIKSSYSSAGKLIMASAFGSTEQPTTQGLNPTNQANTMASWVKTYNLDGLDVDYEDFTAINAANGSAENWLITFTTVLRNALPAGQYVITHAPVAPWFSPIYTAGAYTKVHKQVGTMIDWYNVQFYNQGTTEYTTCDGLLNTSSATFPKTAVFQINANAGVGLNKIVIGKPGTASDASNGFVTAATLNNCITTAKGKGWGAGVMVWEYPDVGTPWITTVRGSAYPIS